MSKILVLIHDAALTLIWNVTDSGASSRSRRTLGVQPYPIKDRDPETQGGVGLAKSCSAGRQVQGPSMTIQLPPDPLP